MNEAQVRSDFALYTDPNGLLQLHPNPPIDDSDNGILFTGHKMIIFLQLGILNPSDLAAYDAAMATCQVPGIPGLFNRHAGDSSQEGPDDYIGLMGGSVACGSQIPVQVLAYGSSQVVRLGDLLKTIYPTNPPKWVGAVTLLLGWVPLRFNWNNQNPGQPSLEAWLGRQPAIIAHMQWAAGETPALWRRIVWFVCMAFLADWKNSGDTSNKILDWHFVNVGAARGGWLEKWGASIWFSNLLKTYTNGMQDMMRIYFGADHPCAKYVLPGASPAPAMARGVEPVLP